MSFPNNPTKTSPAGVELIKTFEGLRLKAYRNYPTEPWTVGYGSTAGVKEGDVITKEEAEDRLDRDLQFFEAGVEKAVNVRINQLQFDALVSFAYNLGLGSLKKSTLLKKLNAGDDHGAAEEFLRWRYVNGVESVGLLRRRKAERELFLK